MDFDFRRLDEVWTADSKKLGLAQGLYHRQDEANPALKLFASYLEVEDYSYGGSYFVPTDFIVDQLPQSGRIELDVTFDEVMKRTWGRMPDFIVLGKSIKEPLLERERLPSE
jgi:hypothetical protein